MTANTLSITLASPSHRQIIFSLLEENRAWLVSKGISQWRFPFTFEWVDQYIEKRQFYIAALDQEIVGVFRLLENDPTFWGERLPDAFYLHSFAVRRSWKGKGIGRLLLAWVEKYTLENNRKYVRLDCMADNAALCAYYEQAGFISCGIKEIQYHELFWKARLYQKEILT